MVKRASGATSYYARVQPANPAARTQRIERNEPKTYIDVSRIFEMTEQVPVLGPDYRRKMA